MNVVMEWHGYSHRNGIIYSTTCKYKYIHCHSNDWDQYHFIILLVSKGTSKSKFTIKTLIIIQNILFLELHFKIF